MSLHVCIPQPYNGCSVFVSLSAFFKALLGTEITKGQLCLNAEPDKNASKSCGNFQNFTLSLLVYWYFSFFFKCKTNLLSAGDNKMLYTNPIVHNFLFLFLYFLF